MAARRTRPLTGRATLAWMAGVFLALQLVGGAIIDYGFPRIRFPELHRELARMPRSPDLVVLGSSRFHGFVDDSELTHELRDLTGDTGFRAFNAAVPGGELITQAFAFRAVLAEGVRPRWVVVEVSPELFNQNSGLFGYHAVRMWNWEDLPRRADLIRATGSYGRLIEARLTPLYVHRYQIVKQAATKFAPLATNADVSPRDAMTESEWLDLRRRPRPLTAKQETDILGVTDPDKPYLENYRFSPHAADALERILDLCQSRNIAPILVGGPATSNFRAKFTPAISTPYEQLLAKLRGRYGVPFVDCGASMPDHLFSDCIHCDSIASRVVFSRLLARDVLAPLLNRGTSEGKNQIVDRKRDFEPKSTMGHVVGASFIQP